MLLLLSLSQTHKMLYWSFPFNTTIHSVDGAGNSATHPESIIKMYLFFYSQQFSFHLIFKISLKHMALTSKGIELCFIRTKLFFIWLPKEKICTHSVWSLVLIWVAVMYAGFFIIGLSHDQNHPTCPTLLAVHIARRLSTAPSLTQHCRSRDSMAPKWCAFRWNSNILYFNAFSIHWLNLSKSNLGVYTTGLSLFFAFPSAQSF